MPQPRYSGPQVKHLSLCVVELICNDAEAKLTMHGSSWSV